MWPNQGLPIITSVYVVKILTRIPEKYKSSFIRLGQIFIIIYNFRGVLLDSKKLIKGVYKFWDVPTVYVRRMQIITEYKMIATECEILRTNVHIRLLCVKNEFIIYDILMMCLALFCSFFSKNVYSVAMSIVRKLLIQTQNLKSNSIYIK